MTEIKIKKAQVEREPQEQHRWNTVQLWNTWIAVGITVVGISIGAASLHQSNWVAVGILLIIGVLIVIFSRRIAAILLKMESDLLQNNANTITRRLVMPNSLKNLATIAAWVLSVLGFICFIWIIFNSVLSSFNIISATSLQTSSMMFVGFGILCFLLAFVAGWIRSKIE